MRHRPQAEKSTRLPIEESEQTTIGQHIFNRPSRRPLTTQQAIPISTTIQDETETHDFFLDAKLANRIKNSSPSSIITTSLLTPTIDSGKKWKWPNDYELLTRIASIEMEMSDLLGFVCSKRNDIQSTIKIPWCIVCFFSSVVTMPQVTIFYAIFKFAYF